MQMPQQITTNKTISGRHKNKTLYFTRKKPTEQPTDVFPKEHFLSKQRYDIPTRLFSSGSQD